jgi:pyridoxal phosphate enzyme (YggS family)
MSVNTHAFEDIGVKLRQKEVTLVAVSKTKPIEDIQALYDLGQRDFGENYVQELSEKAAQLPNDIRWHFIGHLQSNKVKFIAEFVSLIHAVDSFRLLKEIDKQAAKQERIIDCLLQVHIAKEETKYGLDESELTEIFEQLSPSSLQNVRVKGLMGMASFTKEMEVVRKEFVFLKQLYDRFNDPGHPLSILSMGMSGDYATAIEEGSNMVRIGSLLFGNRN